MKNSEWDELGDHRLSEELFGGQHFGEEFFEKKLENRQNMYKNDCEDFKASEDHAKFEFDVESQNEDESTGKKNNIWTGYSCEFCMLSGHCRYAGIHHSRSFNATQIEKKTQMHQTAQSTRSLLLPRLIDTPGLSTTVNPIREVRHVNKYHLDSGGNSPRPETPQSSSSDTETEDDESPIFRHDQINVHEKLSEYISEAAAAVKVAPTNEVTGHQVTRHYVRRKGEQKSQSPVKWQASSMKPDVRNTLSDHCYHLNQPQNLEHLGIQTPSESGKSLSIFCIFLRNLLKN